MEVTTPRAPEARRYGLRRAVMVSAILSAIPAMILRGGLEKSFGRADGTSAIALAVFLLEFAVLLAIFGARDALRRP